MFEHHLSLLLLLLVLRTNSEQQQECDLIRQRLEGAEEPDLELTLLEDSRLYAAPGESAEVLLQLTNYYYDESIDDDDVTYSHVVLTPWERYFSREDSSREQHHAQLTKSIWPPTVDNLGFNETVAVSLAIEVPEYVAPGIQVKVTVSAERIGTTMTSTAEFFFTVSDRDLIYYDNLKPECVYATECKDAVCQDEWTAKLVLADNVTGLRTVSVGDDTYANVTLLFESPLVAGSTRDFSVVLEIPCDYAGVEVMATDVAGNVALCPLGEVASGTKKFGYSVLSTMTWMVVQTYMGVQKN